MPRPKKVIVVNTSVSGDVASGEIPMEVPVIPIETPKEESEDKKKFRGIIERYAVTNPVKYEQKKEKLLAELNSME